MSTVYESSAPPAPMSEQERTKVRQQMHRMLETHHFKNSKRYPALLRFIVEETLEGRGEFLKERLLGVRVFDRPTDYDTASDPIVRVTIAEVRKRIAQYYHDEEHDAEIRIELLPGRYAPEFRPRGHKVEAAGAVEPEVVEPVAYGLAVHEADAGRVVAVAASKARGDARGRMVAVGIAALVVVCGAALGLGRWMRATPLDEMWAPLLVSARPVLFCVPIQPVVVRGPTGEAVPNAQPAAEMQRKLARPDGPTFLQWEALGENIVFSDMLAALRIASVLAVHRHDYRAKLNTLTTLEDLREGPAVLIGGLDNQWTMKAVAPLRFHFEGSDETGFWIADTKNPGMREWSLDLKQQFGSVTRDYAVIARVHSEQTGQPEMIVAGIGMSGTAAAGEFIADPQRMEELRARIGQGFKDRDFEAVLSTDVVNGIAGAPKILAVAEW